MKGNFFLIVLIIAVFLIVCALVVVGLIIYDDFQTSEKKSAQEKAPISTLFSYQELQLSDDVNLEGLHTSLINKSTKNVDPITGALEHVVVIEIQTLLPWCCNFEGKTSVDEKKFLISVSETESVCDCNSKAYRLRFVVNYGDLKYDIDEYVLYYNEKMLSEEVYKTCSGMSELECQNNMICSPVYAPSCPECTDISYEKCIPDPEKNKRKIICEKTKGVWQEGICSCSEGTLERTEPSYLGCYSDEQLCVDSGGMYEGGKCTCPDGTRWLSSGGCSE
jgi:hypothetical protein